VTFRLVIVFIVSVNSQMEERLRYWNGYLLFYERMEEVRTPVSAKKSKVTMWKTPSDKTRQLSVLVSLICNINFTRYTVLCKFISKIIF